MNTYVIIYNDKENLFSDYKVIEGKNPKEALKRAFNKNYERLTGDDGRYANIILVKGTFENNTIICQGRYQRLCYKECA